MDMSDTLAIAAHLHVLLRRKTGRVTDTEWMAENQEYGLEMVRFAKAKAQELGQDDLREWAQKLERALQAPPQPARTIIQSAAGVLRSRATGGNAQPGLEPLDATQKPTAPAAHPDESSRYVGGIR